MSRRFAIDLDPDPDAVTANDPSSVGGFLVVAEGDLVRGLGVKAGVVRAGAVRDPALDDQIPPDLIGVVSKVVALVSHDADVTVGAARPRPGFVSGRRSGCGHVRTESRWALPARSSSGDAPESEEVGSRV